MGTVLTFLFSPPVQITEVIIYNLEDPERFERNARIKGIEIVIDDLPQATIAELRGHQRPAAGAAAQPAHLQREITITSAFPGQTYEGQEPFPELALKEVAFYGRVSPETSG